MVDIMKNLFNLLRLWKG